MKPSPLRKDCRMKVDHRSRRVEPGESGFVELKLALDNVIASRAAAKQSSLSILRLITLIRAATCRGSACVVGLRPPRNDDHLLEKLNGTTD
jgi:hypothetical protein